MSLLQNPLHMIEQIEWYMENRQLEKFPGSYVLAAGNLSRQLLEQVFFILAFYSGVPRDKYIMTDKRLQMAGKVLKVLRENNPSTGLTYIETARQSVERIAKFARIDRAFERWLRLFNEPSHFRNPATRRQTQERHIRWFAKRLKRIVDERDSFLILAAVNELRSGGLLKAVLGHDKEHTPGIRYDCFVSHSNIELINGRLGLRIPAAPTQIVPKDREIKIRRGKTIVLVQGSAGIGLHAIMKTREGRQIDLSNLGTILSDLSRTERDKKALARRLKKLGFSINWTSVERVDEECETKRSLN